LLTHHGTEPTQPGEAFAAQALSIHPNKKKLKKGRHGKRMEEYLWSGRLFTDPHDIAWLQLQLLVEVASGPFSFVWRKRLDNGSINEPRGRVFRRYHDAVLDRRMSRE
jgi:hypothetical protein